MPLYSYSRIAVFEQCPLKYKYAYIDRIKRDRNFIEAFLGNRFHEVMEHLYSRVSFEKPGLDNLKQFFNDRWEHEWNDDILILRSDKTAQDYRAIGIKAIEVYYLRHEPFDQGTVLGLERELITDLDGTGKYKLRCIIDRLMRRADNELEIHDYKTSGTLPIQKDVDEDHQLALYEIAVRSAWPDIKSVALVWHYVIFDTELRSHRTPEQLNDLKTQTKNRIDEIESTREFEAQESSLCDWCDYKDICPLFAHMYRTQEFGKIDYEQDTGQGLVNSFASLDAQKHELAARIKNIEAEQERIRDAAVGFAEKQGVTRLFGDDHVLSIKDDVKVHYPKRDELKRTEFEMRMKDAGLWEEVLDISWPQLKSLVEREGWGFCAGVPEALKEYIEVEKVKRVHLAKRKDKDRQGGDT